jgi:hypothetical protein
MAPSNHNNHIARCASDRTRGGNLDTRPARSAIASGAPAIQRQLGVDGGEDGLGEASDEFLQRMRAGSDDVIQPLREIVT